MQENNHIENGGKMKRYFIWFFLSLIIFLLTKGFIDMFWSGPLRDIHSFSIYYGEPDKQKLKELQAQDALIFEPTAFSKKDIKHLKESDVKLFGYVSLMQLENWNQELKERLLPTDYARLDGERIYVKEWDTYVMDLRQAHFREVLLWKIKTYIANNQLDGIFFDTVDDLAYYFHEDDKVYRDMKAGYAALLKEIEKQYPELDIIQNRGFETYESTSHSYVEGILWESFKANDFKESEWAKKWLAYLKKEQRAGNVRVLTVVTDEDSLKASKKHKFPAFLRKDDTYQ